MSFSWKALLLAPLPIPLLFSLWLEMSAPGSSPVTNFLLFTVLGSVLSYGTTLFLFLPSLFVIARFIRLTAALAALLGTLLGCVIYIPVMWQSYSASGDNSGPPQGSFGHYLFHHGFGLDFWAFLLAGSATAMLYWFLAKQRVAKAVNA